MRNPINIYQLFPRLFGNKNIATRPDGSKAENGCGTFADIDNKALDALKSLGVTHVWLTGVLKHASETTGSHPDITKGRAGSPYAVTDYHAIDPDLGSMDDFELLVSRIHAKGIKVVMDFIPNHVSRECVGFDDEDFYLLEGEVFVNPTGGTYREFPAKATGNDVFAPNPSLNDWYDTVKLNYANRGTWEKMLAILRFWCAKGVDGFRVDMAEMVPLDFWQWAIAALRKDHRPLLLAEIYQPALYKPFLAAGFDYLYDKVGLYNTLEDILCRGGEARQVSQVWKDLDGIDGKMLRFMENHDEKRLASPRFVGDAKAALPAVTLAALMNTGPFMIYNGQESGEDAVGAVGFSGDDGRTSIFDYCTMPLHQHWMNGGQFDGGLFDEKQKELFDYYRGLLHLRLEHSAFSEGAFYDLMWCNPWYSNFDPQFVYAFLRYSDKERLLVVVNFHRTESRSVQVKIPRDALEYMHMCSVAQTDMNAFSVEVVDVDLQPSETKIIDIDNRKNR